MDITAQCPPLRFKYTHPEDAKAYGNPDNPDGWWTYDEAAITSLPLERLSTLETALPYGMTLVHVMQGLRDETVIGVHAASWVAVHLANPTIAGPYDKYAPRAVLIYWEAQPEETAATDPLDSTDSPTSSTVESPAPAKKSNRSSPAKRTSRPKR